MRAGRSTRWLLGAFAASLALAFPPAAFAATRHGFVAMRDGTQLRYSLDLPSGHGPFPVIINYEGYAAGATPGDNGVSAFEPRLLQHGYAVMGVSVRGTGCSQGNFDLFGPDLGRDGYDVVEWAARQPWSNGHVGMMGVSFGGITQFATAADRPPHLDAIVPSSATSDYYRDVVYPGGIFEYDFPFIWTWLQKGEYATSVQDDPDPQCAALYAEHEPGNLGKYFIPSLVLEHPFDDSWYTSRQPNLTFHNIDVPLLMINQWQDEQLPARIFESLGDFSHPDEVWANFSNGNHGRDYYSPTLEQLELDFVYHFVGGVRDRFPNGVPHLMIDMETAINGKGGLTNEPAWRIGLPSIRGFSPTPWPLYLRAGGVLGDSRPSTSQPGVSYQYPLPAADLFDPVPVDVSTGQEVWRIPPAPGGTVAFTSGPLTRDAVVAGPASLDLWLSSTATDTDLQVTVSEVRPDGQEVYIQRGWLRASHRKLDPRLSTVLRPYPTDTQSDAEPLTPGQPTLLRVPIFPFAYAFRKGSRIRVIVDAPTGHTGFWGFDPITTPATNTILDDSAHPSRLVIGLLPGQVAHAPRPACDTLRNEPCRQNPWPAMTGTPLAVPAPATSGCPVASGQLRNRRLGPLALGFTRAHARRALARYHVMRDGFDDFCLAGGPGIRVGYPTGRLLRSLTARVRRRVARRIVLALTANRVYALNGIHPGASLAAARRRARLGLPLRLGANDWYVIAGSAANGLLKVRHGQVLEVGIANRALTANRRLQRRFFDSWSYV